MIGDNWSFIRRLLETASDGDKCILEQGVRRGSVAAECTACRRLLLSHQHTRNRRRRIKRIMGLIDRGGNRLNA